MSAGVRSLRAYLVEGCVILASILVAFGLDGWRADRELDRELTESLRSVERELERNHALVVAEIDALRRNVEANVRLVAIMDSATGPMVEIPDTLAWLSGGWNTSFTASLGAVDALIASGRLALIEDSQLREALAGLKDQIADAIEEEIIARQIVVEQMSPHRGRLIRSDFSLGGLFFNSGADAPTPQERVVGVPIPSFGTVAFPNDLELRNMLSSRAGWLQGAHREFVQLELHLQRILALTSAELGVSSGS